MHKTEFECQIISPTFLRGADGKTPELRPASIKGAMRFWWRAMNGNLSSQQLREVEANLFGSSDEKLGGKSPFSIRIPNLSIINREFRKALYTPVPHKEFKLNSFVTNQKFTILLTSKGDCAHHSLLKKLIILTLVLGGIGLRSRRGFGSVQIEMKEDLNPKMRSIEDIFNMIQSINKNFSLEDGKIKSLNFNGDYPFILEIEIGKQYHSIDQLLAKIGDASHIHNSYFTGYVGSINKKSKRISSPIYVSTLKDDTVYRPIITTLNFYYNEDVTKWPETRMSTDQSSGFKGAIL